MEVDPAVYAEMGIYEYTRPGYEIINTVDKPDVEVKVVGRLRDQLVTP